MLPYLRSLDFAKGEAIVESDQISHFTIFTHFQWLTGKEKPNPEVAPESRKNLHCDNKQHENISYNAAIYNKDKYNNNNNIGFYFLFEHDTSKLRLSFMPLAHVAHFFCSSVIKW